MGFNPRDVVKVVSSQKSRIIEEEELIYNDVIGNDDCFRWHLDNVTVLLEYEVIRSDVVLEICFGGDRFLAENFSS